MFEVGLNAFVALFVMIDPIGLVPMFIALTQNHTQAERIKIGLRAVLVAAVILLVFGFVGDEFLRLLGIGLPAFRISGGIMLFLIAVQMLFEKRTDRREKTTNDEIQSDSHDPSIFPLATPLIAGSGAMATMILLMGQHEGDLVMQGAITAAVLLVLIITFILFLGAGFTERFLGPTLINVITRVFGVILGAMAVQFILDGLTDFGMVG